MDKSRIINLLFGFLVQFKKVYQSVYRFYHLLIIVLLLDEISGSE